MLDLIITDSPGYMMNSGILPPIGDPYHCTIFCKFEFQLPRNEKYKREIWQYDKCDFQELNLELSQAPWDIIDTFNDINVAVKYFFDIFLKICKSHIPCKQIKVNTRDKPWINQHVKKWFKLRDKTHAKFKQSPCAETHLAYTIARRDANSRKFEAKKYYDEKVARKLSDPTTSPKEYWRLTKQVYGKKVASSIPPIMFIPTQSKKRIYLIIIFLQNPNCPLQCQICRSSAMLQGAV